MTGGKKVQIFLTSGGSNSGWGKCDCPRTMRRGREEEVLEARVEQLEATVRALAQRVEQAEAMNTRLERTLYEVTRFHLSIVHMEHQQQQQQQQQVKQERDSSEALVPVVPQPLVQMPRLTRPTQGPANTLLPPLLPPMQPAATAPFSEYIEQRLAEHGACLSPDTGSVVRRAHASATPVAAATEPPSDLVPGAQQRLPDTAVRQMKEWLHANMDHPYPTEADKKRLHCFSLSIFSCCLFCCCDECVLLGVKKKNTVLVQRTGVTMAQLNTWFINARRRLVPKSKARMSVLAAAAGAAAAADQQSQQQHSPGAGHLS